MTTSSAGHWIRGLARVKRIVTHITHVESHAYHFDVLQKNIFVHAPNVRTLPWLV